MVSRIADMGVKVSVSTYNCWRVDNETYMIENHELATLKEMIGELKQIKKRSGALTTGDYYLDKIPEFFEKRMIPGCTAGLNWIQVTPDGMIKRCSDHAHRGRYTAWRRGFFNPTSCGRCWYSCRGAAQEPWTFKRFIEMAKDALNISNPGVSSQ